MCFCTHFSSECDSTGKMWFGKVTVQSIFCTKRNGGVTKMTIMKKINKYNYMFIHKYILYILCVCGIARLLVYTGLLSCSKSQRNKSPMTQFTFSAINKTTPGGNALE